MYVLYFTWDVIAIILNGLFSLQAKWCVQSDGLLLGTRIGVQLSNWSHFAKWSTGSQYNEAGVGLVNSWIGDVLRGVGQL